MSFEANKDLLRSLIEQVWNEGQLDRLPEFWAEATRREAEEVHEMLTRGFPDLRMEIDDIVAEGDRVALRLTITGTHRGEFRGIAPTGRVVSFGAIRFYRLADGKVEATWGQPDVLGLLQQLRS